MASLPWERVTPGKPFQSCGTDLMGPLNVRVGRSLKKRWLCIFNCLSTRAVHFEVVQSLDASAFIQAFRRFCNHRNCTPSIMYRDNDGNFIMANKELKGTMEEQSSKETSDSLLKFGIQWKYNPPLGSHHSGFYEVFFRIVRNY